MPESSTPLRDVRRLGVQADVDVGGAPVEPLLLVADVAHRGADDALDLGRRDLGAAGLAGDDDEVGGRQGLAGDAGVGVAGGEKGVDHGVGDAVAHLVRVALGHRLAGEEVVGPGHRLSSAAT